MTLESVPTSVDLRCPLGAKKLLGRVRQSGGVAPIVEGNLLELACQECRDILHKKNGIKPSLVLHRYNVIGELVESEIIQ